jgi:tRNA threonylcarbamoyladenosine biosynthesis protein TsaB
MILSLDTATSVCSVALQTAEKTLAHYNLFVEQSHATMLTCMIESVLQQAKVSKTALTALAISDGPGSYTGLRVGSSVAKGLCYALDLPLIAVSSLQAMAAQMVSIGLGFEQTNAKKVLLCPMIDARRMEVYTALYQTDLEIVSPVVAKIIDEQSFNNFVENNIVICFGNGAMKCRHVLRHQNFIFIDNILTSAQTIGQLAFTNHAQKVDIAYYESLYLKEYGSK